MKKKLLLLLSISILFFVSSCSTITRVPLYNATIGDKCYLNVKVFQALNSHEALAKGPGDNSIVVKLITSEDTFYDGKVLYGDYIMVDTYTYTYKPGITKETEEYVKTVPVFIKASEHNIPKPLQEKEPEGQKL